MWDEVVTCFQLLLKPHRAELLVRERIAAGEETPYMICSLADLTKVIPNHLNFEVSNFFFLLQFCNYYRMNHYI